MTSVPTDSTPDDLAADRAALDAATAGPWEPHGFKLTHAGRTVGVLNTTADVRLATRMRERFPALVVEAERTADRLRMRDVVAEPPSADGWYLVCCGDAVKNIFNVARFDAAGAWWFTNHVGEAYANDGSAVRGWWPLPEVPAHG